VHSSSFTERNACCEVNRTQNETRALSEVNDTKDVIVGQCYLRPTLREVFETYITIVLPIKIRIFAPPPDLMPNVSPAATPRLNQLGFSQVAVQVSTLIWVQQMKRDTAAWIACCGKLLLTTVPCWSFSSSVHRNTGLVLWCSVAGARIDQPLFDHTSETVESLLDVNVRLGRDLHEGDVELIG